MTAFLPTILTLGLWTAAAGQPQQPGKASPLADAPCRPAALRDFCRVGCPDAAPAVKRRVEPVTDGLKRPLPSGIAVIEVGVDLRGDVVSACVLRGVRSDFDRAAQAAVLRWQWQLPAVTGNERGFVMSVTVCTPDKECRP